MNKSLSSPSSTYYLKYILIALPIVIFFTSINYMAVNVPYQDDFDGLLEPTLSLSAKNNTFAEIWRILFTQDDERRILINRLVSFSLLKTFGDLDLKKQIIAGASTLLICFSIFATWFKNQKLSWAYLIPVAFLLFNIQYFDAILWSMIPFQHIGVYVWAIASLYFLNGQKNHSIWVAITLAVISIFSDVSGVLLWPVGILLLGIQRKWTELFIWGAILGVLVVYYFYDLSVPNYRPPLESNLKHPATLLSMYISMHGLWLDPGNIVNFKVRITLTFITGLISVFYVGRYFLIKIYTTWSNQRTLSQNEFLSLGGSLLITSTFFMYVINRSAEGFDSIFVTRYNFLYLLWAVFCYLIVIQDNPKNIFNSNIFLPAVSIFAIIFCVNSYFTNWQNMDYFRKTLLTDSYEWRENKIIPSSPIYIHAKSKVDQIYENAFASGIYKGVEYPFYLAPKVPGGIINAEIIDYKYAICIYLPMIKREIGKNDGAYIILKSGNENHIFPTKNTRRSFLSMIKNGSYYNTHAFSTPILKEYLKSPEYELEVGVMKNNQMTILETNNKIILSNFQSSNQ